ncbi:Transglutaminase-like superfamily [Bifidobacterium hapali]|uniref:Transglutaminase-like superfamily n=1 Tax=Bifidobacterium hapali TaxID=1630172 RepID=A0A261G453_9BIFI|nr:transglutaminase-like domain-containing protein [Bifidobacterium hapali]OZG66207.1 Transglutaminase-like superfamily [Bifidobacterium hapali]
MSIFSLLDDELRDYADRRYAERSHLIATLPHISDLLSTLDGDRLTLMKLAYGSLPCNDIIDDDPSTLLSFVDHALMLRRTMDWTRNLPLDIFIHFVFWPRINNEALADCRPLCYRELINRVHDLDATHAMLETNYWCAEHVTYHPSDERTLNAIGALNLGLGRCGEESTLLVTALRAIGIPARQVYTPRWAHCDDNHAWVEAYVDGRWRFLGACEPEEVPDRGWFDKASTRAMLVHARVFCDFNEGNVDVSASAGGDESLLLCNLTADYAPTVDLLVHVVDDSGRPMPDAHVSFELLNMAEYYPIATARTSDHGEAHMTLGCGSVRVHVSAGDRTADHMVDTTTIHELTVVVPVVTDDTESLDRDRVWSSIDLVAPPSGTPRSLPLTDEQQRRTIARRAYAETLRTARVRGFDALVDNATRQSLSERYSSDCIAAVTNSDTDIANSDVLQRLLTSAGANAPVIARFLLSSDNTATQTHVPDTDRLALLTALSSKDLCDVSIKALNDAACSAATVRDYTLEHVLSDRNPADRWHWYVRYVLNSRVAYEPLLGDREQLQHMLAKDADIESLREQPLRVWQYLRDHVVETIAETPQPICPTGVLTTGVTTTRSTAIAFVSICRALGIPARFDPQTGEPQVYCDGAFRNPTASLTAELATPTSVTEPVIAQTAQLTVVTPHGSHPSYGTDWSLGRLVNTEQGTDFSSLDLWNEPWQDDRMPLTLEVGRYRLITTVRLPNGNQQTNELTFDLRNGQDKSVTLAMREPSEDELLEHIVVDDATFHTAADDDSQHTRKLSEMLASRGIVAILDAHGSEPSIHVLDELIARLTRGGFAAQSMTVGNSDSGDDAIDVVPVAFVACPVDAPLSATLRTMFDQLSTRTGHTAPPVWRCDETTYERLTRGMYVDPDKLPMILVTRKEPDGTIIGTYASTGYNVGSVDLAFRLATK